MRRNAQQITDPKIIGEILQSAQICRIGLQDGDLPYIVPVNYGYREGALYIHSAGSGKKIELLKNNPHVCFEIETEVKILNDESPCNWATHYRSIIGYADAELLTERSEKKNALDIIMRQHGWNGINDYSPGQIEKVTVLRFRITSLTAKQSSDWI